MRLNKIYIIGAGPAGLACSYYLSKLGFKIELFEEKSEVGGLARSWHWNGFALDTGPHIFHTPYKEIANDWKEIFNDLIIEKEFYACNFRSGKYFDYPINIEQLSNELEFENEISKLKNNKNNEELAVAKTFEEYVTALVGEKLAQAFFKEYPEKLWGISTKDMSSEWAPKRIRITNQREKFFGDEFTGIALRGTGTVMERVLQKSKSYGCKLHKKKSVTEIKQTKNPDGYRITELIINNKDQIKVLEDDLVILTIPITRALSLLGHKSSLSFRGTLSLYAEIKTEKDIIPKGYDWLYFQNRNDIINRISIPSDWSKQIDLTGRNRKLLAAEISVDHTISFKDIKKHIKQGLDSIKNILLRADGKLIDSTWNLERYVYPVKTLDSKKQLAEAKKIFSEISNLEVFGTGANFNYGDMQIMFMKAKEIASELNKSQDKSLSRNAFRMKYKGIPNKIKKQKEIKIIAEIGINHNGSLDELETLINSASQGGASYIKFQHYTDEERISKSSVENKLVEKAQDQEETTLELLQENKLNLIQLKKAKQIVEKNKCIPMTTVFGLQSLKEALKIGFDVIKTASMDLNNLLLHKEIIKYSKNIQEVFISTGMSSTSEILTTLKLYLNSEIKPILLACTSSYPATDEDLNLLTIPKYKKRFGTFVSDIGYSDHSVGMTACIAASVLGANYLEIHFTRSKASRGPDHILSADINELINLNKELKRIRVMMGRENKKPTSSEYETWRLQKKGFYSKRKIKKGAKISLDDLYLKSPPYGIRSDEIFNNKLEAKQSINQGEIISWGNTQKIEIQDELYLIRKRFNQSRELAINTSRKLICVLVSTKNSKDIKPYPGGLRTTKEYVITSMVNLLQSHVITLKDLFLEHSDHIFVDAEKVVQHEFTTKGTLLGNLLSEISDTDTLYSKKVLGIKPSQITVNACVKHIRSIYNQQIAGKRIGIIGLGSIGFRIANAMIEEAAFLKVYSKNNTMLKKRVDVLEYLKPNPVNSKIEICSSIKDIFQKSDVIISCSSEANTITIHDIESKYLPRLILDVGKHNLSKEAKNFCDLNSIKLSRLDIGSELVSNIEMLLREEIHQSFKPKIKNYSNKTFISGGYIGNPGDYVVDDAEDPNIILGILDDNNNLQPVDNLEIGDFL